MVTPLIILGLLVVPFLALAAHPSLRRNPSLRGRVGLACVFFFTAVGHFVTPREMALLIPPFVPFPVAIIYATGVPEFVVAGALLCSAPVRVRGMPTAPVYRYAGVFVVLMLLGLLPFNVYGAVQRVPFGGHAWGPVYLLVRVPLQVGLMVWAYWFAVRGSGRG